MLFNIRIEKGHSLHKRADAETKMANRITLPSMSAKYISGGTCPVLDDTPREKMDFGSDLADEILLSSNLG